MVCLNSSDAQSFYFSVPSEMKLNVAVIRTPTTRHVLPIGCVLGQVSLHSISSVVQILFRILSISLFFSTTLIL